MAEQGGAASGQPGSKDGGKLWGEVFSANGSVVVWLVFLAFGGALLSFYHSKIQYFPVLKWEDSLTYLAALSLLGGGVAVIYGLLLFLPGTMWCEFLIHDTELEDKLCYPGRGPEPCFWNIGLHLGLPFLSFMLIMHCIALLELPWLTAVSAVVLLVAISRLLWKRFGDHLDAKLRETRTSVPPCCPWVRDERQGVWVRKGGQAEAKEESFFRRISAAIYCWWIGGRRSGSRESYLLKYVLSFSVSALASLISLLFIYAIVDVKTGVMVAICTGLVTLTNFLVAVQFRNRPRRAILTAFLATLVLLVCSETVDRGKAALSTGIMKKFGLGAEAQLVALVVNPKGQALFERLKLYPPPEVRALVERLNLYPPGQDKEVIPNVLILSRLGEEYFLKATRYQVKEDPDTKKRVLEMTRVKVMIPRKHVLSWSVQPSASR